jgi:hypothetical protein
MVLRALPLIVTLAAAPLGSAWAKAIEPKAGEYAFSYSRVASTCAGQTLGLAGSGVATWPGAGAAGFAANLPINQMAPLGQNGFLAVVTGPTTPAAGVTNWSGALAGFSYPGKTPLSLDFTATITYATAKAFLITFLLPAQCDDGSQGTDTEVFVMSLI